MIIFILVAKVALLIKSSGSFVSTGRKKIIVFDFRNNT